MWAIALQIQTNMTINVPMCWNGAYNRVEQDTEQDTHLGNGPPNGL